MSISTQTAARAAAGVLLFHPIQMQFSFLRKLLQELLLECLYFLTCNTPCLFPRRLLQELLLECQFFGHHASLRAAIDEALQMRLEKAGVT